MEERKEGEYGGGINKRRRRVNKSGWTDGRVELYKGNQGREVGRGRERGDAGRQRGRGGGKGGWGRRGPTLPHGRSGEKEG